MCAFGFSTQFEFKEKKHFTYGSYFGSNSSKITKQTIQDVAK